MADLIGKIVLTGGPCAGKTTALTRIEEELTERGYKVFIIGETATELIKGGIRPFGNSRIDILKFQELILTHQLNKEKIYEEAIISLPDNEKCVLVCDRGAMDNKAYVTDKQFKQILNKLKLDELKLLDNYDLVIHLVTAADGKEEYYTLSNNNARTETIEEARKLDKKTVNAWIGHNNLVIVDNKCEFDEKLDKVLEHINNLLKIPASVKKQRKFIVDLRKSNLDILNNNGVIKIDINQTYLIDEFTKDKYEKRLRRRNYNGCNTYYLTVKRKATNGLSKIITDKKITEKEYLKLMSLYDEKYTINKTRYSFVKDKQYFKLDVFSDNDIAILEINVSEENENISIPNELAIIDEVTNNIDYQNYKIACSNKFNNKLLKKTCNIS